VVNRRELRISVSSRSVTSAYSGCARRTSRAAACSAAVAATASWPGAATTAGAAIGHAAPKRPQRGGAAPAMYAHARSSESCARSPRRAGQWRTRAAACAAAAPMPVSAAAAAPAGACERSRQCALRLYQQPLCPACSLQANHTMPCQLVPAEGAACLVRYTVCGAPAGARSAGAGPRTAP